MLRGVTDKDQGIVSLLEAMQGYGDYSMTKIIENEHKLWQKEYYFV